MAYPQDYIWYVTENQDVKKFDGSYYAYFPYLDPAAKPKVVCDCGALKCKTTHSDWCSTVKK